MFFGIAGTKQVAKRTSVVLETCAEFKCAISDAVLGGRLQAMNLNSFIE